MRLDTPRTLRQSILVALVALVALATGACDDLDDVRFLVQVGGGDFDDLDGGGGLVIVVVDDDDDGRSGREVVNRPGLRVPAPGPASWSGSFDAHRDSDLVVDVALENARGESFPVGRVALARIPGWTWTVHVHAGRSDPLRGCPRCSEQRAFPLPPAVEYGTTDSLYIAWGGSSSSVALLD